MNFSYYYCTCLQKSDYSTDSGVTEGFEPQKHPSPHFMMPSDETTGVLGNQASAVDWVMDSHTLHYPICFRE